MALANYLSEPHFLAVLAQKPEEDFPAVIAEWAKVFGKNLTSDDLPVLRSLKKRPHILKGVCHPDDARRAIDGGVDAIYVFNHGGWQANGGIPTFDLLPQVVAACGDTLGIRSGTDVVKAVALGATAVGIGRPYAYGLALDGIDGIVHVVRSILAEADLLMAVNGYPTIKSLRESGLLRCELIQDVGEIRFPKSLATIC
jgi:lactate 2-monooxygenase